MNKLKEVKKRKEEKQKRKATLVAKVAFIKA